MAIIYNRNKQYKPSQSKPVNFIPQQLQDRLGKGLSLPLICVNNNWEILTGIQKVQQNMYVTLMTPVGRTLMQPDFGSLLPYMIYEVLTPTLKQQMRITIRNALTTWVPEVEIQDITIDPTLEHQNVVLITIKYNLVGIMRTDTLTLGYSATPDDVQYPPGLFVVQDRALFPPQ